MSKGKQLWPGDEMRAFFRVHIRRETSLDDGEAKRLAAALTRAISRMLVWEVPRESEADASTHPAPAAPQLPPELLPKAEAFNPYLFSVIVVLTRQGPDGLLKRLQDIKTAENLLAFAHAQHVPVDPSIEKPEDIRKAIVEAAQRRLADRKAAAS